MKEKKSVAEHVGGAIGAGILGGLAAALSRDVDPKTRQYTAGWMMGAGKKVGASTGKGISEIIKGGKK
jgi:hypothetical protein